MLEFNKTEEADPLKSKRQITCFKLEFEIGFLTNSTAVRHRGNNTNASLISQSCPQNALESDL